MIVVEAKGITYRATVDPGGSEDTLILLRHILLQYYGQSVEVISRLNIDMRDWLPFVR